MYKYNKFLSFNPKAILSYTDMQNMVNKRLPVWVTGTCNFSRFDDVKDSGGETLLLNARGGGIALVSTTRTVYSSQNTKFNLELSRRLLQDNMTIGEAVRQAKNERAKVGDDNRLSFVLLGDPALRGRGCSDDRRLPSNGSDSNRHRQARRFRCPSHQVHDDRGPSASFQ